MPTMSESQLWSFLEALPARPAVLATTRMDGSPHAAPIWYAVDGRSIVFNTGDQTVKGRNLRHDARVSLVVDDDRPPFSFAVVTGRAALSEDPEEVRHWATVIGGRYMGEERAEEFGARNGVTGELLVRVRPDRLSGVCDLAG
jgi:PPOX class probable F420-dependent enzyme